MSPTDIAKILGVAETLAFNQPPLARDEACYRSAVSRAYYAAFHAMRNAIRDARQSPLFDPGHLDLCRWLRDAKGKTKLSGELLNELREMRVTADYKLDAPMQDKEIKARIRDARDVIAHYTDVVQEVKKDPRQLPPQRQDKYI